MSDLSIKKVPEDKAIKFLISLTLLMQEVQLEMSSALVTDPQVMKKVAGITKLPDHEIIAELSKAVRQLVLMMPVASNYGVNLVMNVLETHSLVTGDQTLNNLLAKVMAKLDSAMQN